MHRVPQVAAKLGMCWEVCSASSTLRVAERVYWCLSRKDPEMSAALLNKSEH